MKLRGSKEHGPAEVSEPGQGWFTIRNKLVSKSNKILYISSDMTYYKGSISDHLTDLKD